jgi:superfamily II DNA or RNA helicase
MSIKVNINNIDENKTSKDLSIELKQDTGFNIKNKYSEFIYPYTINDINGDSYIDLPFAYAIENGYDYRPKRLSLPSIAERDAITFSGELREEQKLVKEKALKLLTKTGSIMISSPPGFGKTCLAINLCCNIKLITLIIVKGTVLLQQWEESIKKFSPLSNIQIIKPKNKILQSCDFYIVNAENIHKFDCNFLKRFGCVVVDEAHQIMSKKLHECMYYLFPRYLIGLTATPYRPDDLDILLKLYFGSNILYNKLFREHIVYKLYTPYTPEIIKNVQGKTDWNNVLKFQSSNIQRSEDIINLVRFMKDRVFLIMCKRVEQANYIMNRLIELGEDVTSLIGSQTVYEKSARILVGIIQKVGVGFDHPRLNTLILASDVLEYFVQYIARTMRTKDGVPIIFDFIDNNSILESHSKIRTKQYIEHGGIIRDFKSDYPDCDIFDHYRVKKLSRNK